MPVGKMKPLILKVQVNAQATQNVMERDFAIILVYVLVKVDVSSMSKLLRLKFHNPLK